MDPERKGEIAHALLKYKLSKEGLRLSNDLLRELGNVSKTTGIPFDELKEFLRILILDIVDAKFPESTKEVVKAIASKAIDKA